MDQQGFYHNSARCTGCNACMMACKDLNNLSSGISYRKVLEYGNGSWVAQEHNSFSHEVFIYYLSVACNHCAHPICVSVCPTGAMHKDDGGFVTVNTEYCIGCGYCQLSCPYRAPKVDPIKGQSVKCDACIELRRTNNEPACVSACPLRALSFGPISELKKLGGFADIAPLPPVEQTLPNLIIAPHPEARPSGSTDGMLLNDIEL